MKKIFLWVLIPVIISSLVVSFSLIGCKEEAQPEETVTEEVAEEEVEADEIVFGYVMYSKTDFWNAYTEKAFKFAAEIKGVKVISLDAEGNQEKSLAAVEDLITSEVDAIDYYPISPDLARSVIQMLNEEEIPVVIENMIPTEGEGTPVSVVYVGYDNMGYNVGKWLSENYPNTKIFMIEGQRGMGIVELYMDGLNKALDEFGTVELVGAQATNWTQDEAFSVAQNIIQSGQEFDIMVANNEDMSKGVLKAVKEADKFGEILVMAGGGGGFLDGLELVANGELIATTSTPAGLQGLLAFKALWQHMNGKDIEDIVTLPTQVITKDNIDAAAPWEADMKGIELIGGLD